MAAPRDYTDKPHWKDIQSMLAPVVAGSTIAVLLLIYALVRYA